MHPYGAELCRNERDSLVTFIITIFLGDLWLLCNCIPPDLRTVAVTLMLQTN